jgi:hypothetical protein
VSLEERPGFAGLDDLDRSVQDEVEGKPAVPFSWKSTSPGAIGRTAPGTKCVYLGPAPPGKGDIVFGWHVLVIANLSRCDSSWPRLLEFPIQRRGPDTQFFRRLGAVAS